MKYKIIGGKELRGTIKVSGSKNAVFPCLAAALLTDEEVTIENVPLISDVEVFKELLVGLGAEVRHTGAKITIKSGQLKSELPEDLTKKLRGSIVLIGALLGRVG